jgi:hypothetical protein
MSEEAENAGGGAAGEQETIDQTQGGAADTGGGADTGAGLGSLAEDAGGEPAAPADWPTDWRERLAGKDDGFGKLLKRFTSPENFAKAYTGLQKKLSTAPTVPTLPENATEEQVAEYRKAIGVPETPDGYGVAFAPEVQADDRLNTMLQSYLSFAHERNLPPSAVKAAVEWQQGEIIRQREEQTAAAARERARVQQELRREYGADFKRNLGLADEFLDAHPGLKKYVRGDSPDLELVRDIVALALDAAPEDRLMDGDGDSGGRSLDEQVAELSNKSIRGKLTPAEDAKLNHLIGLQLRRNERTQSNAA